MLVEKFRNDKTLNVAEKMMQNTHETTDFLKSIAHPGRLMILCKLAEKPASVGELEEFLNMQQAAVSKQLSRLRQEGLVKDERRGRSIIYSIGDVRARILIDTLYDIFCRESTPD